MKVRWRPVSCDQFPPFEISRKPIEGSTVTSKPQGIDHHSRFHRSK